MAWHHDFSLQAGELEATGIRDMVKMQWYDSPTKGFELFEPFREEDGAGDLYRL